MFDLIVQIFWALTWWGVYMTLILTTLLIVNHTVAELFSSLHAYAPVQRTVFIPSHPNWVNQNVDKILDRNLNTVYYVTKRSTFSVPDNRQLVVLFHGNASNINSVFPLVKAVHRELSKADNNTEWWVVAPEYHGYCPDTYSSYFPPSECTVVNRAIDAVYALQSRHGFNNCNTTIMGTSIGTGVACEVVNRINRISLIEIDKLVLVSPFTCLKDVFRYHAGILACLTRERFDNAKNLSRYHGRLALFHGKTDILIPAEHSRSLADICRTDRVSLNLLEGGHNDIDQRELTKLIAKFVTAKVEF